MIEHFEFSDLRELFAKANEEKSGDNWPALPRTIRERRGRGETQACGFYPPGNSPTASNRPFRDDVSRHLGDIRSGFPRGFRSLLRFQLPNCQDSVAGMLLSQCEACEVEFV